MGETEYLIGPKRVLKYGDKAMIIIPKPLVEKLGGKIVQLKITVVGEEKG